MTETTALAPVPTEALDSYASNPIPDMERLGKITAAAYHAEITEHAHMEKGADLDRMLAAAIKKVDEQRKGYVQPLNQVVSKINGNFNGPLGALKDARKVIQGKLTSFRAAEQRRIAEEEAAARKVAEDKALAEAEKLEAEGDSGAADEVLEDAVELPVTTESEPQAGPVRGDYGGTSSFVKVWEVEVNDPDKVPREFCSPDQKKLREAVKNENGLREIEGCTITETERVITR